jgi:hypothetical protein
VSISNEAGPAARVDDVLGGSLGERPVRDRSMSPEAEALLREWFGAPLRRRPLPFRCRTLHRRSMLHRPWRPRRGRRRCGTS